jgi:hypothetical protein
MKQSISETDTLLFIQVDLELEAYDLYINKFETEMDAVHLLEFRIESMLRSQRKLLYTQNFNKKKTISLAVNKKLVGIMERYCAIHGLSHEQFIYKVMKWTKRRKQ